MVKKCLWHLNEEMKFSDIRQLYAVYVHFIAFLDKLLVEQALEKDSFYGFFLDWVVKY